MPAPRPVPFALPPLLPPRLSTPSAQGLARRPTRGPHGLAAPHHRPAPGAHPLPERAPNPAPSSPPTDRNVGLLIHSGILSLESYREAMVELFRQVDLEPRITHVMAATNRSMVLLEDKGKPRP